MTVSEKEIQMYKTILNHFKYFSLNRLNVIKLRMVSGILLQHDAPEHICVCRYSSILC